MNTFFGFSFFNNICKLFIYLLENPRIYVFSHIYCWKLAQSLFCNHCHAIIVLQSLPFNHCHAMNSFWIMVKNEVLTCGYKYFLEALHARPFRSPLPFFYLICVAVYPNYKQQIKKCQLSTTFPLSPHPPLPFFLCPPLLPFSCAPSPPPILPKPCYYLPPAGGVRQERQLWSEQAPPPVQYHPLGASLWRWWWRIHKGFIRDS